VEATLTALEIIGMFDAIVCAEDYKNGKPAPDPYLEAARRLGVPSGECLVFEDTPTGVEGARAAGMECVLVPTAERTRN
jgi:HAD superfamily hydrolase (TIGR01509 family)